MIITSFFVAPKKLDKVPFTLSVMVSQIVLGLSGKMFKIGKNMGTLTYPE